MSEVTQKDLRDIRRLLEKALKPDLINESEAAELLGVRSKTLNEYVCRGTIPPTHYTVGINGKRFYDRDLLTGLKSKP